MIHCHLNSAIYCGTILKFIVELDDIHTGSVFVLLSLAGWAGSKWWWQLMIMGMQMQKWLLPMISILSIFCGETVSMFCVLFLLCSLALGLTKASLLISFWSFLTELLSLSPKLSCLIQSDCLPPSRFALLSCHISSDCHAPCRDVVSLGALLDNQAYCSSEGRWCPHPKGWWSINDGDNVKGECVHQKEAETKKW